jgi:putative DNA primase/helicase
MTNHETNLNTDDGGLTRRLKRIVFRNVVHEGERDPDLTNKLVNEGSAIVNKLRACVPGIEERGGIQVSEQVRRDTADLIDRQDIMGGFVSEKVVQGPDFNVKGSDLFAAYRAWCATRSVTPKSQVQFYRNFEKKVGGVEPYQRGDSKTFRGVGLVS